MGTFTFIHAADIHLGRPFSGIRQTRPELDDLFLRAGYWAWNKLIQTAIDKKVSFVTLGGDTFDAGQPNLRARLAFRDGIDGLRDAGIKVFMVLGNHDPLDRMPESLMSLEGLYVFGVEPDHVRLELDNVAKPIILYGISFQTSVVKENLVTQFKRVPDTHYAIGVLHANVSGSQGHEPYAPCSLDDLRSSGMDMWCLGHVHQSRILNEDPLILYPGTVQGAHINERGPKGCYLITVDDSYKASTQFVPLCAAAWERLEVDITEAAIEEDIVGKAKDACSDLAQKSPQVEAIMARLEFVGKTDLSSDTLEDPASDLTQLITEHAESLSPTMIIESTHDKTVSNIDLESLAQEDGFLKELLEITRQVSENPDLKQELFNPLVSELVKKGWHAYIDSEMDPRLWGVDSDTMSDLIAEAQELIRNMFLQMSSVSK